MTITGICYSCFMKIVLSQRPRSGLCVVCPKCGSILESLHIIPPTQEWFCADMDDEGGNYKDDHCFTFDFPMFTGTYS